MDSEIKDLIFKETTKLFESDATGNILFPTINASQQDREDVETAIKTLKDPNTILGIASSKEHLYIDLRLYLSKSKKQLLAVLDLDEPENINDYNTQTFQDEEMFCLAYKNTTNRTFIAIIYYSNMTDSLSEYDFKNMEEMLISNLSEIIDHCPGCQKHLDEHD